MVCVLFLICQGVSSVGEERTLESKLRRNPSVLPLFHRPQSAPVWEFLVLKCSKYSIDFIEVPAMKFK